MRQELERKHIKNTDSYTEFYDRQSKSPNLTHIRKTTRQKPHYKVVKTIINNKPPVCDVLDIGCQHGILELTLSSLWYNVTATDIADGYLEGSKKNTAVLNDYISYHKVSVEYTWEYFKKQFDVVVCSSVLEHVADFDIAWNNIDKLVKPNGLGVFMVPFEKSFLAEEHVRIFTEDNLFEYFPEDCHVEFVGNVPTNPASKGWFFITRVWK